MSNRVFIKLKTYLWSHGDSPMKIGVKYVSSRIPIFNLRQRLEHQTENKVPISVAVTIRIFCHFSINSIDRQDDAFI